MIRLLIVSRKVTDKTFKGQGIEDLRTQYHAYFSIYHGSEQNLFESAKSMKAIVDSMLTNAPELSKLPAVNEFGFKFDLDTVFQNLIFFTIISDYSEEKTKMLKDIQTSYLSLLEKKTAVGEVGGLASSQKKLIATNIESWGIDKVEIFQDGYPHAAEHKVNFKKQLIQHNVIICSSYYERVRLHRLAELSHVAPGRN
jgi:26S proteasome regulatory subunit N5